MILKRFNVEVHTDDPGEIAELKAAGYEELIQATIIQASVAGTMFQQDVSEEVDLAKLTKKELVALVDVPGAGRMTKAQLIEHIKEVQA